MNEKRFIRLADHDGYADDKGNLGYQERLRHLLAVKSGAPCFAVMVRRKDTNSERWEIGGFNSRDVFRLGEIEIFDGDEWGELGERIPVAKMTGN